MTSYAIRMEKAHQAIASSSLPTAMFTYWLERNRENENFLGAAQTSRILKLRALAKNGNRKQIVTGGKSCQLFVTYAKRNSPGVRLKPTA